MIASSFWFTRSSCWRRASSDGALPSALPSALQPADDGQSVATAPDGSADGSADGNADGSAPSNDALRQQLDLVNQKLDAIMIAMAQLRR